MKQQRGLLKKAGGEKAQWGAGREILHSKDIQSVRFHADGMSPILTTQGWNAEEKTKEPGLGMKTEKSRSTSALSAQTPSED